ncbi:MAG: hypothetical protein A2W11_00120 [Ignavibacteria bacterium RBG_16_35_7]|nr:MAG: hypothetical protein A2W11_00120 [Ignavibacteria bacterium RBG_16_35_7]
MEKNLKLNTLGKKRIALLPMLKKFKNEFYLAGGTALALQLGHRKSFDFDFFAIKDFRLQAIQNKIDKLFQDHKLFINQYEADTFTILINNEIKISFFSIKHKAIAPFLECDWFWLCSELEIGAMKISALLRADYRDYVDIYFLLKKYNLAEIINLCKQKYPAFEVSVYLKALLSYDDIEVTPIMFTKGFETKPEEVFSFIENKTKTFISNNI